MTCCTNCGRQLVDGDEVYSQSDDRETTYVHAVCPPVAPRPWPTINDIPLAHFAIAGSVRSRAAALLARDVVMPAVRMWARTARRVAA